MPENETATSAPGADRSVGARASITCECASVLNFAMDQNGVPLVREIRVRNDGPETMRGAELRIRVLPDISEMQRIALPSLAQGEEHRIGPVEHRVNGARLRELTEAERGEIVIEVASGDVQLAERRCDVRILTSNEWPGTAAPLGLLAAFVTPNHPVITTLLQDVREKLRHAGQRDALDGYQSARPERAIELANALHQAVQSIGIGYVGAPASFEEVGQKIRLPDAVLQDRLGCCLDLSVLFASALEAMGLAPLLLLVRGHALAGLWLRDDRFPEGVVLDAARLRTLVDLGALLPFEATAVTAAQPVKFEDAVRVGLQRIRSDEEFHCAIDVRALRAEYRPIPLRVLAAGPAIEEVTAADSSYAARILARAAQVSEPPPAQSPDAAQPKSDVDVRFRRWKERLLDLTLRNRLLNFKPDAKSALRLEVPDLELFEDGLWGGREFEILPRPDQEARDARDARLADQRVASSVLEARLLDLQKRKVHCRLTSDDLWTRLRSLDRDARTALEEGGAVVLYAAVGILRWYETAADTDPCLAPLLLVPVELTFDARTRRASVRRVSDDPVLNVTLVERLRRDYAIDASELGTLPMAEAAGEETGVAVRELLRRFRDQIQQIPRWEVLEDVHLGIFHFTKFLMWKDLEDNAELFLRNAVVRRIASRDAVPLEQNEAVAPATIDRIPPSDLPTVLDADSTQMAAIASALDNQSFVLQGPPGTGKSQTIANLVAASLARGRTVLFVSEKMAALDVVHRRLRDVGLGDFCLELHSHKANKKDVVSSLHAALTHRPTADAAAWNERCESLSAARAQLNAYVDALHRRGTLGLSVYEARGRLLELHEVPDVRVPPGFAMALEPRRLAECTLAVEEFATRARPVEPLGSHPFASARRSVWTAAAEEQLRDALGAAHDAATQWEAARDALARELSAPQLGSSAAEDLAQACATYEVAASPAPAFAEDWPQRSARARACTQARRDAADQRARLSERWGPGFVESVEGAVVARFQRWATAFFLFAWIMLFNARRQLKKHAVGRLGQNADILADLLVAASLRADRARLDGETAWSAELLGTPIDAPVERWDTLLGVLDAAHPAARRAAIDPVTQRLVSDQLRAPLPQERQQKLAAVAATASKAAQQLRAAESKVYEVLDLEPDAQWSWADPEHPASATAAVERWRVSLKRFREMCLYRGGAAALDPAGLSWVAEAHARGTSASSGLRDAFEKAVLRQWHAAAVDGDPALRDFDERLHTRRVDEFRAIDREHIRLSRQHTLAELEARLPSTAAANIEGSEPAILMREAQKRARLLPIRRLLREIPTILPRLKPCFLMSPLSVAQYLPPEASFDLVVFDEASQICTHEAIGAVARGKQVIIVGDSRQMPPTSFFSRSMDADEDDIPDENDVVELESVLDEAVAKLVPQQWLGWHYRSRHESLIDFSNRHIYDSRLDVFPAAEFANDYLGVAWRRVQGVYRGGNGARGRTNQKEAEAVVAHLVERLRAFAPEERTFGVVTFNIQQQRLILDLLDEERLDPLVERHFGGLEPVFVKNLENVQGDERDEIAFSICNAPDENGRFIMSFGAVNLAGGERRLNVAVTRARKQIVVFSSIDPEQIERSRTKSKGTWLVREFLQYARERGGSAHPQDGVATSDNAQDRAVGDTLRAAGFDVREGIGCGRYRLDAAVLDPKRPGQFTVAVEGDGPAYHSAATARDRDRLRSEVLARLDWHVERVWSSAWWFDAESGRRELVERVRHAAARDRERKREREVAPPHLPIEAMPVHPVPLEPPPPARLRQAATYQSYEAVTPSTGSPELFYGVAASAQLRDQLLEAIDVEGPIHERLLARRVLARWGIPNVTARPMRRVTDQLAGLEQSGRVVRRGEFLWPLSRDPSSWRGFRDGGEGERARDVPQIAPEEIANAAAALLREAGSLQVESLLREVASLFGVERVGAKVREAIEAGIAVLIESERVSRDGERIRTNGKE